MKTNRHNKAFATLLVMIVVGMTVVLGLSYLSSAAIHVDISRNFSNISRARYVAESGLQHGLYALRTSDAGALKQSMRDLGTFTLSGTTDSYRLVIAANSGTQFTLTATGSAGGAKRTSSAVVIYTPTAQKQVSRGMSVASGTVWLPWCMYQSGDIHVNGQLLSYAAIDGNVSASGGVMDFYGRINGTVNGSAASQTVQPLTVNSYASYKWCGAAGSATVVTSSAFDSSDVLNQGGSITSGNPGGVVYWKPSSGQTVTINNNVNFQGTIIADGDVIINGSNINLTSVKGFPAIVCGGSVRIGSSAQNVVINGVVSATTGVISNGGSLASTSTTVNGAVLCMIRGYDVNLDGNHRIYYKPDLATLFDFSLPPEKQTPTVKISLWAD